MSAPPLRRTPFCDIHKHRVVVLSTSLHFIAVDILDGVFPFEFSLASKRRFDVLAWPRLRTPSFGAVLNLKISSVISRISMLAIGTSAVIDSHISRQSVRPSLLHPLWSHLYEKGLNVELSEIFMPPCLENSGKHT